MLAIPPAPLPADLTQLVEESVTRFENRLPAGMGPIARMNGWIEDYRKEVTELARQAFKLGTSAPPEGRLEGKE